MTSQAERDAIEYATRLGLDVDNLTSAIDANIRLYEAEGINVDAFSFIRGYLHGAIAVAKATR